jgi:arginyl-tRNA synthetase
MLSIDSSMYLFPSRDWVIYITDAGQAGHFDKVFQAARAAGWVASDRRLDHIGFGVVQGEDGKKFKTRSGDTVKLIDLLNSARDEMMASLKSRADEGKSAIVDESEILDAATKMGYGAVKYFDLKQNPTTNYVFNYSRMLDTRGDTAIYLLFAYARLASILRKAHEEKGVDVSTLFADSGSIIALDHPAERALAFELMQFGDVITAVLQDLSPNRICDYLSGVSIKFTDFVTKCNVLNSDEIRSRLLLCECTKRIMAQCFYLLGISTLDRI